MSHQRRPAPQETWQDAETLLNQNGREIQNTMGTALVYEDHLLSVIMLGTTSAPKPAVQLKLTQDDPQLVFTASKENGANPGRYNTGRWTNYLRRLAEAVREQTEQFRSIDDSSLFPED